jgi:hypothetical protein
MISLALIYAGVTNDSRIWECLVAFVSISSGNYRLLKFCLGHMPLTVKQMPSTTIKASGITCVLSLAARADDTVGAHIYRGH